MKQYTLADVQRSYTPAKRWSEMEGDLPSFLLYRPVSIWLTPPLLRAGVPATAVTLAGLLLTLALPVAAWAGGTNAYLWVAGLALANHVTDCIDGNIARTTGRFSGTGALLDGFCDLVFWTLYLASIGVLAERAGGGWLSEHGMAAGLVLGALVLLHRNLRDNYALVFEERAEFTTTAPKSLSVGAIARMVFIALERFYAFGVLIAGALGAMEGLLWGIGAYVVIIFIAAVGLTFGKAVQQDGLQGGK